MKSRVIPGLVTGLLGCGQPAAQLVESASVRDSAGIQIVEHPAGYETTLPKWVAADPPAVEIGGRDEEPGQDLHLVRGAARLQDGRIVVVNGGTAELRFFDGTGKYLFAAGRQGNGPGEFAYLALIQRMKGDTLFAIDGQLRRGSLFAPSGEFIRSMPTDLGPHLSPSEGGSLNRGYVAGNALLSTGKLLGGSNVFPEMKETSGPVHRLPFAIVFLDPDSSKVDTIAVVPGTETYPAVGYESGHSFPTIRSLEFARQTVYVTDGEKIYVGTNEPDGVRVYDVNGKLLRIIRTASPPEPVTEEHRQRRAQETLARLERQRASEQIKAEWRKNEENKRYAETFPFYERLLVGSDGSLWVELPRRYRDEAQRYIVYDSTGRAIATVRCPERMRPYEVGPDAIIGMWRDPDEVQHVRVYKVSR